MTDPQGTDAPAAPPTDTTAAPGTAVPSQKSVLEHVVASLEQLDAEFKDHAARLATVEQSTTSQQTSHSSLAADFEDLKTKVEDRLHNLETGLKQAEETLTHSAPAPTLAAHQTVADAVAEHTKNLSWARREIDGVKEELAQLRKLATGA